MAEKRDTTAGGRWKAPPGTIDRYLDEHGMSLKEFCALVDLTANTIRKLETIGVSWPTLEAIALGMGVRPESLASPASDLLSFYPMRGLCPDPPVPVPEGGTYQDWGRRGNNQPIAFLWAEANGSSIKAEVLPRREDTESLPATAEEKGEERSYLRLWFENAGDGEYPSNVGIHPQNLRAVLTEGKRYLCFRARLADESGGAPIGIAVRLGDAQFRQWVYQGHWDDYLLEDIQKRMPDWQDYCVDLTGGPRRWKPFAFYQSLGMTIPDFSVVTRVVFEVGQRRGRRRPSSGRGVLDITDIVLSETAPSEAKDE